MIAFLNLSEEFRKDVIVRTVKLIRARSVGVRALFQLEYGKEDWEDEEVVLNGGVLGMRRSESALFLVESEINDHETGWLRCGGGMDVVEKCEE